MMNDLDLSILGLDADGDDDQEISLCDIPLPAPPAKCTSLKMQLPEKLSTLEDVRNIWLAARSPQEIALQAQTMPFGVWMDYMIKLTPKQLDVKGQIDMRAAFVNLGPPQKR